MLRRRYLNAHPARGSLRRFQGFLLFDRPSGAHLVAGFGRIIDQSLGNSANTETGDAAVPIEALEKKAIEQIDDDHRDAYDCDVTRLLGAEPADTGDGIGRYRGFHLAGGTV